MLKTILLQLQQQNAVASLLVDEDGLTRREGVITNVEESNDLAATRITLDQTTNITLMQIIAVNGLFRSDYSEC